MLRVFQGMICVLDAKLTRITIKLNRRTKETGARRDEYGIEILMIRLA
jgi:hypothetical protein